MIEVIESHAVAAADGQPRGPRDAGEARGQARLRIVLEIAAPEDGGRARARADGLLEHRLEPVVVDAEDGQVHGLGQCREARVTRPPGDFLVVGVDGIDPAAVAVAPGHAHAGLAEGALFRRGADDGDRIGRQQRREPVGLHHVSLPMMYGGQSSLKRASRQAMAALRPSRLETSRNLMRSGVSRLVRTVSMSSAVSSASVMPMFS